MAIQRCAFSLMPRMFHTSSIPFQTSHPNPYHHLMEDLKTINLTTNRATFAPLSDREHEFLSEITTTQHWRTLPIQSNWTDELKPFRRAIAQIIEPTFAQHCPHFDSVLEIGSGTFPIRELLPNVSAEDKSRITLSEINEERIQFLQDRYPDSRVQEFDVLAGQKTGASYERVVMSDVLNIFSNSHLERAFKTIYKTLSPGGILLHFSIRIPFFNFTLDEFRDPNLVWIPIVGEESAWKGVCVVRKADLILFAEQLNHEHNSIKKILNEYIPLSHMERESLCLEYHQKNDMVVFQDFVNCLEKFHCPGIKKVYFNEHYHERLKLAAITSGLQLLEFQEKEGYFIGPRSEGLHLTHPENNAFTIEAMLTRMHYLNRGFSPELVHEQAKIHVLAAQKPIQ